MNSFAIFITLLVERPARSGNFGKEHLVIQAEKVEKAYVDEQIIHVKETPSQYLLLFHYCVALAFNHEKRKTPQLHQPGLMAEI